jgi:hypothetical protein
MSYGKFSVRSHPSFLGAEVGFSFVISEQLLDLVAKNPNFSTHLVEKYLENLFRKVELDFNNYLIALGTNCDLPTLCSNSGPSGIDSKSNSPGSKD